LNWIIPKKLLDHRGQLSQRGWILLSIDATTGANDRNWHTCDQWPRPLRCLPGIGGKYMNCTRLNEESPGQWLASAKALLAEIRCKQASTHRGVTRGSGGHNSSGAESLRGRWMTAAGAEKCQQCHKYFNTIHLVPKDLRFEHGGAKLAFCPGPRLTSLRPWVPVLQRKTYVTEDTSKSREPESLPNRLHWIYHIWYWAQRVFEHQPNLRTSRFCTISFPR